MKNFVESGCLHDVGLNCGSPAGAGVGKLGRKSGDVGKNHHPPHRTKENPCLSLTASILDGPDGQQGKLAPFGMELQMQLAQDLEIRGKLVTVSRHAYKISPQLCGSVAIRPHFGSVTQNYLKDIGQGMIMRPFKVLLDGALSNGPTHRLFNSLGSRIQENKPLLSFYYCLDPRLWHVMCPHVHFGLAEMQMISWPVKNVTLLGAQLS